jgi:SAM-dependent methyltransferase
MKAYSLEVPVTNANFDETGYLAANPDVADAVRRGRLASGRSHYDRYGKRENRRILRAATDEFRQIKAAKLARIAPLLRRDVAHRAGDRFYDFLTEEVRSAFGIDDGGGEGTNDYDPDALAMFARHADGLVLDVGAGRRATYYDHVVNLEIAPFDTTDVRGVAERLPFVDASFDAVISIAVLEHVRDPFAAASEIVRVLKPAGELICCVPFLQPLHGYPHHYYNMTHEGLRNLFERQLVIDRVAIPDSTLPIWSLAWILRSWMSGLEEPARSEFGNLRVRDLVGDPVSYLTRRWVRGLPHEKNLELASACVLHARKPA